MKPVPPSVRRRHTVPLYLSPPDWRVPRHSAHIFSTSEDCTPRKWQSIDGEVLVVLRGHTKAVTFICQFPDDRHLVTASRDCSIRIWDVKANQLAGEPLLHDGELLALVISSGSVHDCNAQSDVKVEACKFI
ncbi:hypothetical protein K503DRAFT_869989 [Rhizopogon vinicolor AM-OR11-026]|uniref:Uncharacterized protein n=1 Tax=Rhizopogon vinicolor AM-OR11-026 TaxID=1314800 RepID=A0A1B7MJF3_9AGAM|nr:hypothetical protein K503DRAFT_869989 [Rhizopogon vinicolor AM-OR11-026]